MVTEIRFGLAQQGQIIRSTCYGLFDENFDLFPLPDFIAAFALPYLIAADSSYRYGTKVMASSSSSSLSSSPSSAPSPDIVSGGLGFHAGSNINIREQLSQFHPIPPSSSSTSISSISSADNSMSSQSSQGRPQHASCDPMEHTDETSMGPDSAVKKSKKEKRTTLKNIFNKIKNSGSSSNTSSHC